MAIKTCCATNAETLYKLETLLTRSRETSIDLHCAARQNLPTELSSDRVQAMKISSKNNLRDISISLDFFSVLINFPPFY